MIPTNSLVPVGAATSAPPAWPAHPAGPGTPSGGGTLFLAALGLAAAAVAVAAALRRWPAFNRLVAQRVRLRVLESRGLAGRCHVHLLECEGRRFLVGSSPAGVTLVSEIPAAAPEAPGKGDA